ncbi:elongation of very long chain fatty acids protein 2 [Cricetulus griseus]|uniref:Elongation of very long chain fatty acids protein 2 n=1 Tax=Cricetulus griseus TaxID=10029 RepID=A0A061IDK5_CRIGR|nr:elongation of very long chain fatty acids protein 2 [Cricetulus griseus]
MADTEAESIIHVRSNCRIHRIPKVLPTSQSLLNEFVCLHSLGDSPFRIAAFIPTLEAAYGTPLPFSIPEVNEIEEHLKAFDNEVNAFLDNMFGPRGFREATCLLRAGAMTLFTIHHHGINSSGNRGPILLTR